MYKVRIILDTKQDVIRTITVDENQSLEKFHISIAKAFGFNGKEMASFYRTDDEWSQGEEIPLFDMSEMGKGISMSDCTLKETLSKKNNKLIYVYDFFEMWTFYVEVIDILDKKTTDTKIILSIGDVPNENPNKTFKAEDFNDDLYDDFNDFDRLDDLNLEDY